MRGDLERRKLVVSIKAARRQENTKQVDLRVEITVDEGVSLQTMRWCKQYLDFILTKGLLDVFGVWDLNWEKNSLAWRQTESDYVDYDNF